MCSFRQESKTRNILFGIILVRFHILCFICGRTKKFFLHNMLVELVNKTFKNNLNYCLFTLIVQRKLSEIQQPFRRYLQLR